MEKLADIRHSAINFSEPNFSIRHCKEDKLPFRR